MKNWKRLLALLLSGAMALSLFACAPATDDGGESPSPDPSAQVSDVPSQSPDAGPSPSIEADLSQGPLEFSAGLSPDDVLLTVNGAELPADLVLYMVYMNCLNMQSYLSYFGMTLADVAGTMLDESVSMAVSHSLIRQKAAELGCLLTDAQNAEIRAAMDEADLPSLAPYWGLTDESAEFIFAMNAYYNNVLEAATHEPDAEELDGYLDSKGVFAVKHILLKTVGDDNQPLPDADAAAKKTQAEELLSQLQGAENLPALFDELMMAHSEDNPQNNPDGYVFDSSDSLVGGFREAALELEPGGLSGIVETDYGYHIILRLPLTGETKDGYAQSFRVDALDALIAQWQAEADVTRSDALDSLDVAGFYDRLTAYQQALEEKNAPAESAAP